MGGRRPKNAPGITARNHLYALYRQSAQKKKLIFDLSLPEFIALTQEPCHYCGIEPLQEHYAADAPDRGAYVHNGIDRVDNRVGYTARNCEPCCSECNYAKRQRSYEEFTAWLDRVAQYRAG
jgi:hypothetical protein